MIVVPGRIDYPPDANGNFPQVAHAELRLDLRSGLWPKIVAAKSSRDPASGFLISEEIGPAVYPPEGIVSLLKAVFARRVDEVVEVTLSSQGGELESCGNRKIAIKQPLSRWSARLAEVGEELQVQLSADLRATLPFPDWDKSGRNHWEGEGTSTARLVVEFRVDAATRVACFGCYFPWGTTVEEGTAQIGQTTAQTLRLEDAPVGPFCEFATTPTGGWISFTASSRRIGFRSARPQSRASTGFISPRTDHIWPLISLHGVDMDVIAGSILGKGGSASLVLTDGWFGHLQQHWEFYGQVPRPDQSISKIDLHLSLTVSGLDFAYEVFVNDLDIMRRPYEAGWLKGRFILPWELLILRYPEFALYRGGVLESPEQ